MSTEEDYANKAKDESIEIENEKNVEDKKETKELKESEEATTTINTQKLEDYKITPIKLIKTNAEVQIHKHITKTNIDELELKNITIITPTKIESRAIPNFNKKKIEVNEISKPINTNISTHTSIIMPKFNINKPIPSINNIIEPLDIKPLSVNNELLVPKKIMLSKINKMSVTADISNINMIQRKITPKVIQDKKSIDSDPNDDILVFDEFHELKIEGLSNAKVSYDRPMCLILPKRDDESYVYSLALICRELYRIVKGGKPEPTWLSEDSKREIEENTKAGNRVFIIDDAKGELLPKFDKITNASDLYLRVKESKLFDRLSELFSQGYGFIIFHIPKRWFNEFTNLLKQQIGYLIPQIIPLNPEIMLPEEKRSLAKICWGFVDVNEGTFDEILGNAEKNYYELLNKRNQDIELKHYIEGDENAGFEHEALKLIAVKALAKELGAKDNKDVIELLKQGKIKTEEEFSKDFRTDIYIPEQNRYIEIETFYGTGDPISKKLDKETLNKYKGMHVNVDIVLLGLHLLLYAKDLFKLKKIYKEYNIKVNFYTIDVKEERLVSIKEIRDMLKSSLV